MMASLDALNEARLAAAKATADAAATTKTVANKVDTTSLAGIQAASNSVAATTETSAVPVAETAAQRLARITKERETGGGTTPPSEAPAGTHWSFIGGQWKLYKDSGSSGGTTSDSTGVTGLAKAGSKIFQFLNGKMYYDGSLFTGEQDNAKWENGIKIAITSSKDEDGNPIWKPISGASKDDGTGSTTTADLIAKQNADALAAAGKAERQSAFDILYNEFNKYGLGSMVDAIKGLITDSNVNPSQFSLALQNTDAYKKRFSANQDRIAAGLRALTPAEYIGLEDAYQSVMRNYGLPASYYTKDSTGKQSGFDKFIAGDVSAPELEDRIATAQQRVINSNPEVLQALKQFYPDINNADILAYTLDPKNGLDQIKRKVTAAEIGGAALAQGLQAQGGTAESLAGLGVTKAQAQQGYTNVAEMVPRGSQLSDIYNQGPYNQQTAEAEVFNTAGAAQAAAKRKKLTALETASFSGSSGVGSLNRDRAVSNYMLGQPGAGSY